VIHKLVSSIPDFLGTDSFRFFSLFPQSQLIANPNTEHKDIVDLIKLRIEGHITAQKFIMISYNCSKDILNEAIAITPGKRSPTVTGLEDGNYKAVSSLVLKKEVSEKMDALHNIGATDILVFEISNSRM